MPFDHSNDPFAGSDIVYTATAPIYLNGVLAFTAGDKVPAWHVAEYDLSSLVEASDPDGTVIAVAPTGEPSIPFDPESHSVDEVLDYLATADDDETLRVLDLERGGKSRVKLVGRND